MPSVDFVSPAAFDSAHPTALAVYCSDGRFTQAVEDLLHALGHPRIDTLTIPGGAALFNRHAGTFSDFDAIQRASSLLITSHGIRRVVLLAHHACGYYRAGYSLDTEERRVERQVDDLRVARLALLADHPHLEITGYFAAPAKGRVVIRAVPF